MQCEGITADQTRCSMSAVLEGLCIKHWKMKHYQ